MRGMDKVPSRLFYVIGLALVALILMLAATWLANIAPAMAVGVTTDGGFSITSHRDGRVYLWNLRERSKQLITNEGNIYSAYAVPGRSAVMWQDTARKVHIQSIDGESLLTFASKHDTYGHLITEDLKTYISSDDGWAIYMGYGPDRTTLKAHNSGNFLGFGKLLNLAYNEGSGVLLSAGDGAPSYGTSEYFSFERQSGLGYMQMDGVTLWSLETLEPIAKLPGNIAKTHATLSPDGQWVVSGDENGNALIWPTSAPDEDHRMMAASYHHGLLDLRSELPRGHPGRWDRSQLIDPPDGVTETTVSVKFIHESRYYLRFGYNSHYAALFEVDNPWPLKYFDLGQRPFPATDSYARNLAIDTAPEAGILVMGQRDGAGILVYQFDPDELTLERVWVGR